MQRKQKYRYALFKREKQDMEANITEINGMCRFCVRSIDL